MTTTATTVNASEETISLGELSVRFLLTVEDTNGSASIFEMLIPAGERLKAPTHMNDSYEETIYGIEGHLTWTIDGVPMEIGPGQAVCIRRGVTHRFDNLGSEDARQLVVTTPAIMGPAYFHDVVDVLNAAAGGPPDFGKIVAVFKAHGMTVAPPERQ
jgi:quercetin dioxygenase-like cupin family protein